MSPQQDYKMNRKTSGSSNIILVGERGNFLAPEDAYEWTDLLEIGAFTDGSAGRRLRSLGLEWSASINLLPPMPTKDATWHGVDQTTAKNNAKKILGYAAERGYNLVLCGARVASSFDVRYSPLSIHEREGVILYVMPHPSGRNFWWNTNTVTAKEFIRIEIMKENT